MINFMMLVGFAAFSVWMFYAGLKQGYKSGHREGFEAGKEQGWNDAHNKLFRHQLLKIVEAAK